MICNDVMHFSVCGPKILAAVNAATTPQSALAAADEWAERYAKLYAANASVDWQASDQESLEQLLNHVFDATIGEYIAVEDLAFSLALAKYLPKLAALIGFMQGPILVAFYTLLVPSPVSNDFTVAKDLNDQIHLALMSKIDGLMNIDWRQKYSLRVKQVLIDMNKPLPNP